MLVQPSPQHGVAARAERGGHRRDHCKPPPAEALSFSAFWGDLNLAVMRGDLSTDYYYYYNL